MLRIIFDLYIFKHVSGLAGLGEHAFITAIGLNQRMFWLKCLGQNSVCSLFLGRDPRKTSLVGRNSTLVVGLSGRDPERHGRSRNHPCRLHVCSGHPCGGLVRIQEPPRGACPRWGGPMHGGCGLRQAKVFTSDTRGTCCPSGCGRTVPTQEGLGRRKRYSWRRPCKAYQVSGRGALSLHAGTLMTC